MKKPLNCLHCGIPNDGRTIGKSFLLFPKFNCGACKQENLYPAPIGARILHWMLALIFVLIFVAGLMAGTIMVPGIIFIAGFWGIFADMKIRQEVQRRQAVSSVPPPLPADGKPGPPVRRYPG